MPLAWQSKSRRRETRRRPSTSLLLRRGLLGGGLLGGGGLGGGFLGGFLLDCHWYHLVVQRHTCLSLTGMIQPVPAPIDTKSFNDWKRNFTRNRPFFLPMRSDAQKTLKWNHSKPRISHTNTPYSFTTAYLPASFRRSLFFQWFSAERDT
jgi:hypothetical protein